jgi:dTDP-4-dehydrorhamnose 3,5-epimerase-like enzyme
MFDNSQPHIIEFAKIGGSNLGYISVAEEYKNVPFEIKRVYWTYFTPNDVVRGGHAHKSLKQLIFAVSGVITFTTEDTQSKKETFVLDNPNKGLYFPEKIWRDIQFSHNAVLLCLASEVYEEEDYIRDYEAFNTLKNG